MIYLIPALIGLGAATAGWMRIGARSYLPLIVSVLMLAAAGWACWLIGAQKTGGYLAGLVGTLLALLMGVGATGLVAGAVLRFLHERLHLRIKRKPIDRRNAPARPWDVMAFAALSVIAILFSAME